MNTHKCPVTDKLTAKLVSELQDILVLLEAGDKEGRLDFLRFRAKTVDRYGQAIFHEVLQKAKGGLNVKGLYYAGTNTSRVNGSSENRSTVPQANGKGN